MLTCFRTEDRGNGAREAGGTATLASPGPKEGRHGADGARLSGECGSDDLLLN